MSEKPNPTVQLVVRGLRGRTTVSDMLSQPPALAAMCHFWRKFTHAVVALTLPFAVSAADQAPATTELAYLHANHWFCVDEAYIVALADSVPSLIQKAIVYGGIYNGKCWTAPFESIVVNVSERQTERGASYICYHHIDDEEYGWTGKVIPLAKVECALPQVQATLDDILNSRSGDYVVRSQDEKSAMADCTEGGFVSLRFSDKKVLRYSGVLMHIRPKAATGEVQRVQAEDDIAAAFRSGCKGVDLKATERFQSYNDR